MQVRRIRENRGNVGAYALTRVVGVAVAALTVVVFPAAILMGVRAVLLVGRVRIAMAVILQETRTVVRLHGRRAMSFPVRGIGAPANLPVRESPEHQGREQPPLKGPPRPSCSGKMRGHGYQLKRTIRIGSHATRSHLCVSRWELGRGAACVRIRDILLIASS